MGRCPDADTRSRSSRTTIRSTPPRALPKLCPRARTDACRRTSPRPAPGGSRDRSSPCRSADARSAPWRHTQGRRPRRRPRDRRVKTLKASNDRSQAQPHCPTNAETDDHVVATGDAGVYIPGLEEYVPHAVRGGASFVSARPIAVSVRRPEDALVDARVSATTPRDGLIDNRFQLHDRRQPPIAAPRKTPSDGRVVATGRVVQRSQEVREHRPVRCRPAERRVPVVEVVLVVHAAVVGLLLPDEPGVVVCRRAVAVYPVPACDRRRRRLRGQLGQLLVELRLALPRVRRLHL